ncbi:DciA family protein [Arsukibacterium sp.]|uniref:DciA family protein n=1 Tax=Arsukibacterium sp. TaxID=1977258 RepID=UPI002FD8CACB
MKRYTQKPQTISRLFGQSRLAELQQQQQLLSALNAELCSILQLEQLQFCQVASIKAGRVQLLCNSAAWATRLKMQRAAILDNFRQKILPDLAGIDIEVSPHAALTSVKATVTTAEPAQSARRDLSEQACHALQQAVEHTEGPVQAALQRLLQHRK